MFKILANRNGQGSVVQYSLTFFLVVAIVTTMSVFVRRAVQGKIFDGRNYMFNIMGDVYFNSELNFRGGGLFREYEPYYLERDTQRVMDSRDVERGIVSGDANPSGIYQQEPNERTQSISATRQLPAGLAR